MSNLTNCSKCGALFVKKTKDICDKCYKNQLALVDEITSYVQNSPLDKVHLKTIVEHFKITMNDIEQFLSGRRLNAIEHKLIFNCIKCNETMTVENTFSFICKKCILEMKTEALKKLSS